MQDFSKRTFFPVWMAFMGALLPLGFESLSWADTAKSPCEDAVTKSAAEKVARAQDSSPVHLAGGFFAVYRNRTISMNWDETPLAAVGFVAPDHTDPYGKLEISALESLSSLVYGLKGSFRLFKAHTFDEIARFDLIRQNYLERSSGVMIQTLVCKHSPQRPDSVYALVGKVSDGTLVFNGQIERLEDERSISIGLNFQINPRSEIEAERDLKYLEKITK